MRLASSSGKYLLVLTALLLSSCGSSSNRQLQSVSISPPAADAKNFPGGQVQFVATGVFSGSSSPVTLTSNDITWCYGGSTSEANATPGMCVGDIAQFASVDQNGLAQCAPLFQGSVYILAGTLSPVPTPTGVSLLKVYGSGQLTCP